MTRRHLPHRRPPRRRRTIAITILSSAALIAIVTTVATLPPHSDASPPEVLALTAAAVCQAPLDSANVLGHEKCAECHQSEVAAWKASPHAVKSFQQLSAANAAKYATALGITGDLSASLCANCHATKHAGGVLQGVSCEACHGASGPPKDRNGWFSIHSYYGKGITDRKKETPGHAAARLKAAKAAGMNRSSDAYDIAKNCVSCHTVPNEKLVNAGHPTSRFELVEWSQGSVRHNFQIDQKVNAEAPSLWLAAAPGRTPEQRQKLMYVVGQLADLEVSLRNRAGAAAGDFGDAANGRIYAAKRRLSRITAAELEPALAAVDSMDRTTLAEYGTGDNQKYAEAADAVAEAARAFAKNHDGSKLGAIRLPRDSIGEPFQAN